MDEKLIEKLVSEIMHKLSDNKFKPKILIVGKLTDSDVVLLEKSFSITNDISSNNFECILIASTDLKMLSNLGNCIIASDVEYKIIKTLFENKKVYVLESSIEYKNFKRTKRKNLFNVFLQYEKNLQQLGYEIIESISDIGGAVKTSSSTSVFINKKIITERDLINIKCKTVKKIEILPDSIISPLAEDFLQNNNINVLRLEG